VVERARKKQSARIANIKEGDANTKKFTFASMAGDVRTTSTSSSITKDG
jgi:hypothetical protein